jgi:alanine dehydrogenase
MVIGVPKEIKEGERRVGMRPPGVRLLVSDGHHVIVEEGAGRLSGITDEEFRRAGAEVVPTPEEVWNRAEMVVKVKEPQPSEYGLFREGLILFTYLHLAANSELTRRLMESGVTAIAYETVELDDGSLPLLTPMSEIAGRMAVQIGARLLESDGGEGVLLGGVPGVPPANVVILGAGTVGSNAARIAVGMGANVFVLDIDARKLRHLEDTLHGRLITLNSSLDNIERAVSEADLVIGCVYRVGERAPVLVDEGMVRSMKDGAAVIDVAVDQGGCIETTHPTTHLSSTFTLHGVVHYCVPNMPAAVPKTSTRALTDVTLPYVRKIAGMGLPKALEDDPALRRGLNVHRGEVAHPGLASSVSV